MSGVDQRIEEVTRQKLAAYQDLEPKAIQAMANIIRKVADGEFARAEQIVKQQVPAAGAAPAGANVPSVESALAQINQDRQALDALLSQAKTEADLQDAQASFPGPLASGAQGH
jgi:predicted metal-dependent TIM-barrel fold hydrolase